MMEGVRGGVAAAAAGSDSGGIEAGDVRVCVVVVGCECVHEMLSTCKEEGRRLRGFWERSKY